MMSDDVSEQIKDTPEHHELCPLLFSNRGGQRSCFQEEVLHLVRYLSAHHFIYPKILFH